MIRFLVEGGDGNKELKNRRWFLPDGIRAHLEKVRKDNKKEDLSKNHTTKEAWDHLVFILGEEKGISYNEMKRIKNWFDKNRNATKTKQYELYGGETMKTWVDNQLNSAALIVKQHKEAQRAMGKENSFRKAHDADKQTTVSKVDTKVPTYNPATLNKQNRLKELSAIKEQKTVIITSQQKRKLNEAMSGKLRTDFFNELETYASVEDYNDCIKLCTQYFGKPVNSGSARMIFEVDDNIVLKLATSDKGLAQNKAEAETYSKTLKYKEIFPKIYSHSQNYTYILAERVIPLDYLNTTPDANGIGVDDVEKCLGVSMNDFKQIIQFVRRFVDVGDFSADRLNSRYMKDRETRAYDFVKAHTSQNLNFKLLMDYLFDNPGLSGECFCTVNLGMAQRSGKPWIVILDNGWNGDVAAQYGYNNFGELNV